MVAPSDIPISGGTPQFQRLIRQTLQAYPGWYIRAAQLSRIEVTNRPEVRQQVAMYEHGSRCLYVYPGVGDLLLKAIGHELAHGVDDREGVNPHWFTSTPEWVAIHAAQPFFDIEKYRDEPLEYFADMVVKLFLLGEEKMRITNPDETKFITTWVWPVLQRGE